MRIIQRGDKVLSISHRDADGVASQIVLGNIFTNISYFPMQFERINDELPKINCKEYDHVFMTDIYPSAHTLMDKIDNLIYIDHHDTASFLHDPKKMRFVDSSQCAASLTKKFVEAYFKVKLSHLDRFIFYVNDYDLWLHTDPFSRKFNVIYDMYREIDKNRKDYNLTSYRNRFMNGNVTLSQDEVEYLEAQEKGYVTMIDALNVMEFIHIKAGFIMNATKFLNEVAHDFMKNNGYRVVFIRNSDNGHTSVRHNVPSMHIGEILQKMNIGGGHKFAGGMSVFEPDELTKKLLTLEKYLYVHYPEIRRE